MLDMHMSVNKITGLLLAVFIMGLSACGFQLRGHAELPAVMQRIYLQSDASTFLLRHLRQSLVKSGSQLVDDVSDATAILVVDKEEQGRGVLSVSDTARVREYESRYSVSFSVSSVAGDEIVPRQTIEQRRDYSFNENVVLAKEREEASLIRDMQIEAVQGMLRKIMYSYKSASQP
jgi:LPS-assembly lipoprotein